MIFHSYVNIYQRVFPIVFPYYIFMVDFPMVFPWCYVIMLCFVYLPEGNVHRSHLPSCQGGRATNAAWDAEKGSASGRHRARRVATGRLFWTCFQRPTGISRRYFPWFSPFMVGFPMVWIVKAFISKFKTGWWFQTWLLLWECHHPNGRNHIFQRGRYTTNQ